MRRADWPRGIFNCDVKMATMSPTLQQIETRTPWFGHAQILFFRIFYRELYTISSTSDDSFDVSPQEVPDQGPQN